MESMGISIGPTAFSYAESGNNERVTRFEHRMTDDAKQAQIQRKEEISTSNDFFGKEEGAMYGQEILVQLRSNFNSLFYERITLVRTKITEINFVYIYFSV